LKEALDQTYVTIGIEIHSESPEEVAVNIKAELIQVREESIS
jgi:xanthine/CO dehydrogenase XdhC/CoxF family maturation factor